MFRYKVGTVRIFGTQEFLTVFHGEVKECDDVKDLILTDNYLQFYTPHNIDQFKEFFNTGYQLEYLHEGFIRLDIYRGIKYREPWVESISNDDFFWSEQFDTWKKNIHDKYSFEAEYTVYLNSPEREKEKQLRKINKLEKILAKHKELVIK